jgi:hypothetical protein
MCLDSSAKWNTTASIRLERGGMKFCPKALVEGDLHIISGL